MPTDNHIVVQQPPTAQNWAIGCAGTVTGVGAFDHPPGKIEGANQPGLTPASLYRAQRQQRLQRSYRHHWAIADAYVRGGDYSALNYGDSNKLLIKEASADYRRWAYMKFDLAGENHNEITAVRLRLNAAVKSGDHSIWVSAYGVPNTSWIETGITWANKPALDSHVQSSRPVAGPAAEFEWDVTDWVLAELESGRTVVSLAILCPSANNEVVMVDAREDSSGIGPQLLVNA
ncbi:CBM96 family carbohydrate-binding protein [Phytoactinopolyspora halotolerans]|uniref:DNRLRE domain-containing protein n=1 Tax=Phytoactinopolyspora halotolerans TaxID=1981512 RepID=A0A6L9SBI8_9ACTN|nr:DNRLRE domain-containing protein [Phytoactinopolyspora halotolerans]NEE02439.1 DNRLRE domain-containing protein [Phytoactinopolyspora halotolerans]